MFSILHRDTENIFYIFSLTEIRESEEAPEVEDSCLFRSMIYFHVLRLFLIILVKFKYFLPEGCSSLSVRVLLLHMKRKLEAKSLGRRAEVLSYIGYQTRTS